MKLEQYIRMKKKEDGIDEYDLSKRSENIQICVSYVHEYFENYLENQESKKSYVEEQKRDRYRKSVSQYSPDIQDWLVDLYSRSGKYVHRHIHNLIGEPFFLLFSTEAEFRALTNEIYPEVIEKVNVLSGEEEMIYRFLRDEHRIKSKFESYQQRIHITDNIDEWISNTFKKYGVNIFAFCDEWAYEFSSDTSLWESSRKIRNHENDSMLEYGYYSLDHYMFWEYDYKSAGERFGLKSLFNQMPEKDFTKGKKQEFDAVLLYWWTQILDRDNVTWDEYRAQLEEQND